MIFTFDSCLRIYRYGYRLVMMHNSGDRFFISGVTTVNVASLD